MPFPGRLHRANARKKGGPRVVRKPPCHGAQGIRSGGGAAGPAGESYWEMMLAFLMMTGWVGTSSNMPLRPVCTPLISSTTRLPSTTTPNTA